MQKVLERLVQWPHIYPLPRFKTRFCHICFICIYFFNLVMCLHEPDTIITLNKINNSLILLNNQSIFSFPQWSYIAFIVVFYIWLLWLLENMSFNLSFHTPSVFLLKTLTFLRHQTSCHTKCPSFSFQSLCPYIFSVSAVNCIPWIRFLIQCNVCLLLGKFSPFIFRVTPNTFAISSSILFGYFYTSHFLYVIFLSFLIETALLFSFLVFWEWRT